MFDLFESIGRWYTLDASGDPNFPLAIYLFNAAIASFFLYLSSLMKRKPASKYTFWQIALKVILTLFAFLNSSFFTVLMLLAKYFIFESGSRFENHLLSAAISKSKCTVYSYKNNLISRPDAENKIKAAFKEVR